MKNRAYIYDNETRFCSCNCCGKASSYVKADIKYDEKSNKDVINKYIICPYCKGIINLGWKRKVK